jgi:hypothetical protein
MKKILGILFGLFLMQATLSASEEVEERELRQEIRNRMENLLQSFDSSARVDVEVNVGTSKAQVKLDDSTPFLINTISPKEDSKKLFVSKLSVMIYSKLKKEEYPAEVHQSLERIGKSYIKKHSIAFIPINVPKLGIKDEFLSLNLYQKGLMSLVFSSFVFFFLFKAVSLKYQRKANVGDGNLGAIIAENMNSLRSTIENVSMFKSSFENDFARKSTPMSFEINAGQDTFYRDFNLESLEEILMDCYWAEEDEYASFVWSKLDTLRKGQLLSKNVRLAEYAKHLSNVNPVDKKYLHETYYFHPLSLADISNEGLSKIVSKFNSVFHLLPRLRIQGLEMDAFEKKKILIKKYSKNDTEKELQHIAWNDFKTTSQRSFDSLYVFNFESLEEEEKFFNDGRIDFELARSFPSLMWLSYLPKSEVEDLLAKYNAKELALAWIGPESILIKLKSYLPKAKVEMIEAYAKQIVPTKKSEVFNSIMDKATSSLKSMRKSA